MRKIAVYMQSHVVIIGAGAAGYFAAVNLKRLSPDTTVTLLEKGNKVLSKVRVSGGGRCNVTHACFDNSDLVGHYPRGERELRGAFSRFSTRDTVNWFEEMGVKLKTEGDGRMFPQSDSSETIVQCLQQAAETSGVVLKLGADVRKIERTGSSFLLHLAGEGRIAADQVIVTTGGNPKMAGYDWLKDLGHTIVPPVPSLFTFNLAETRICALMGISVPAAKLRIEGSNRTSVGPLLITHWGFSGPAVLKLSAQAARDLADCNYHFQVGVSWIENGKEDLVRNRFAEARSQWNARLIVGHPLFDLPRRLWEYFVQDAGIPDTLKWADLPKKNANQLVAKLVHDVYTVKGKTTFKEEFVTCGGVSLGDIDFKTLQSRRCPGLYFAGEVLDIDGVTGGFNFQSAWTTGWIAAQSIAGAVAARDPH
jgi:predicted Rossmann fold flavoprotein